MFSKATLIGVVGVEPKYKAAAGGKDSLISFRLGCEVFTSSKKITEWYTIKAFGRVADYLHHSIKKGSFVFLEASIRNKHWTVDGVERHSIEFHAFTARAISASNPDVEHPTANNTRHVAGRSQLAIDAEINAGKARKLADDIHQTEARITDEKARELGDRFRQILETQKQRIADLAANAPTKDVAPPPEKIPAVPALIPADGQTSSVNPKSSAAVKAPSPSGNTLTDALLNAKKSLSKSSGRTPDNSAK